MLQRTIALLCTAASLAIAFAPHALAERSSSPDARYALEGDALLKRCTPAASRSTSATPPPTSRRTTRA